MKPADDDSESTAASEKIEENTVVDNELYYFP